MGLLLVGYLNLPQDIFVVVYGLLFIVCGFAGEEPKDIFMVDYN